MLNDDPPPGTPVRFVRDVGLVKSFSTATLKRALGRYSIEQPTDLFEVEPRGRPSAESALEHRGIEAHDASGREMRFNAHFRHYPSADSSLARID